MSPTLVVMLGVGLFLTPAVILLLNGCRDEGDIVEFLMRQPMQFIFSIRLVMFAGVNFVAYGVLLRLVSH